MGAASCGCTPGGHGCEEGAHLLATAWYGMRLIESPAFLERSFEEREQTWREYQTAVDVYLVHCGYVLPVVHEGGS